MKADAIIHAWKEQAKLYLDGTYRLARDEDSWEEFAKGKRLSDEEKWIFESILNAIVRPPAGTTDSVHTELRNRCASEHALIKQYCTFTSGIRYTDLLNHALRVERQIRKRAFSLPPEAPPAEERMTLLPSVAQGIAKEARKETRRPSSPRPVGSDDDRWGNQSFLDTEDDRPTNPIPMDLKQSLLERCRTGRKPPDADRAFTEQEADTYKPDGNKP